MKLEQIPSLRIVPDYLLSVKGGMSLQSIKDNFDVFDNDPGNIFFGIYDEDKIIGTIWFQVDDITKELFIIIFSLDKKYHSCDGYNIKALAEVARAIKKRYGIKQNIMGDNATEGIRETWI
jgi:hypothetical protein